jgi:hypothetical protein
MAHGLEVRSSTFVYFKTGPPPRLIARRGSGKPARIVDRVAWTNLLEG